MDEIASQGSRSPHIERPAIKQRATGCRRISGIIRHCGLRSSSNAFKNDIDNIIASVDTLDIIKTNPQECAGPQRALEHVHSPNLPPPKVSSGSPSTPNPEHCPNS